MPSSSSSKLSQVTPSSTTAKRSLTKKKTALDRAKEAGAAAKEEAYLDSLCVRLTCSVILDSFPFGALIGLSIAVFGIIYQLDGLNMSEPILQKYIPTTTRTVLVQAFFSRNVRSLEFWRLSLWFPASLAIRIVVFMIVSWCQKPFRRQPRHSWQCLFFQK